jgi:hypothetical protein
LAIQNFKIKHGLNLGDHELIDSLGNINLPAGANIQIDSAPLDALPDQTGQFGKYLTTNGTDASWGVITQPTLVSQLTNDSGYQTGAQVASSIAALVDTAPSTLDTLNELAAALGDDPNFATSIATQIGAKWTQDNTKISHWDSAYSWGNHANAGYLNYSMLSDGTGHGFKVGQHLSYYSFQTEGTTSGIYFNDSFGFLKANYIPVLQWDQNKVTIKNSSYTDTITLNGSSGALTAISFIGDGTQLTGVAKSATTYTKTEVDTSLALKADITTVNTALSLKSDQSTTYTKAEVDTSLALKANQSSTYTKTEVDTALSSKADTTTVNSALALKADQSTTYTKTQVDTSLALKADQSTTYTKTQVDTSLALKANQSTTYTKTEVDTSLALKANQSSTYTKTEVDTSLGLKLNNAGGTMTGQLNMTAHIIPTAGATYDLGSSTVGWRNVYTNDLHLSNEGHDEGNSVDGTRGNWTIQEGSENLYIINNKSGKKYKFALEEIL